MFLRGEMSLHQAALAHADSAQLGTPAWRGVRGMVLGLGRSRGGVGRRGCETGSCDCIEHNYPGSGAGVSCLGLFILHYSSVRQALSRPF